MITIIHDGHPIPAPRPRLGKFGRTYNPEAYTTYKDWLTNAIMDYCSVHHGTVAIFRDAPVELSVLYVLGNRRKNDIDNLIKTTMDSITASGVINDDSQIVKVTAHKTIDARNPRVEFTLRPFGPERKLEIA
jgi:Holliday junction resolvase RusA-like endonuclease